MSPPNNKIKLKRSDLIAGGILVVFAVALAWLYVSKENTFYFHDFNFYQFSASFLKRRFFENPLEVLMLIAYSTRQTYNFLYTLPLIPFQAIFGESRVAGIESVVVLYLVPYMLSFGAILSITVSSTVARVNKRFIFWICVFVAATIPSVWAAVLRGYPDVAAALLINVAVYLYLRDVRLSSRKRIILIGLLLALAPLIRRHYVYTDAAFMIALALHQFALNFRNAQPKEMVESEPESESGSHENAKTAPPPGPSLKGAIRNIVAVGISTALFLCTVGCLFVFDVLTHNYPRVYESFRVPIGQSLEYFGVSYGLILWAMAIAGCFLFVKDDKTESKLAGFVASFAILDMLVWIFVGCQLGIHYTLHFNSFLIIGIATLAIRGLEVERSGVNALSSTAIATFLLINLVWSLSFQSLPGLQSSSPGWLNLFERKEGFPGILFSANYHPLVRKDKEEVFRLVKTLREIAPGEPVLMASGSDVLNRDTVLAAERELFGRKDQKLKVMKAPYADSEECYPLERLLHSEIVIVATPIQLMIEIEHERVLSVVLDCFEKNWPLAGDFEKLNENFRLENDVQVVLYRRVKQTSLPTAIDTLERMKAFIGRRGAGQPDWIGCGTSRPSDTASDTRRNSFEFPCQKTTPDQSRFLLSTESFTKGGSASGRIESSCGGKSVVLSLMIVNKDGSIVEQKTVTIDPEKEAFDLQNDSDKECYFVIEPHGDAAPLQGDATPVTAVPEPETAPATAPVPPPKPNTGSGELIVKDLILRSQSNNAFPEGRQ